MGEWVLVVLAVAATLVRVGVWVGSLAQRVTNLEARQVNAGASNAAVKRLAR